MLLSVCHSVLQCLSKVSCDSPVGVAQARQGQERSQTFKWFAATLLWYFTDRLYMVSVTVWAYLRDKGSDADDI